MNLRHAELTRFSTSLEHGTFGVLCWRDDPLPVCLTLEDPWRWNRSFVSCIPAGEYVCQRFDSPTHGSTHIVTLVRDRTYILFHRGNVDDHTEGCILLGNRFGTLSGGRHGIMDSAKAWDKWWRTASQLDEFLLSIVWAGGHPPR